MENQLTSKAIRGSQELLSWNIEQGFTFGLSAMS